MVGSLDIPRSQVTASTSGDIGFENIHPNPFNPAAGSAELHFILSEPGLVILEIYDEMGREIRKLADSKFEDGSHSEPWDGRDESGTVVAPGVYFCRLSEGGRTASMKILVTK